MRIRPTDDFRESQAVIKVIGVGGAGCNAVNRMVQAGLRGVEFIAANTDAQSLKGSLAEIRIQVGENATRGLGVGGDPVRGRQAMLESEEQFREVLQGADLAFITGGMGGGTGTGGAPVVAGIARSMNVLAIGVVTRPFEFEGLNRARIAEDGLSEMRQSVDTLLVIPNQRLFDIIESSTRSDDAFHLADDVLRKSIQSISDVITTAGVINTDLNDIRVIMKNAGEALIGMGEEEGPGRAHKAAEAAVKSPLLENVAIDGARGLIVNVAGRKDSLMLSEIDEVMRCVKPSVSPDAQIKVGKAYDDSLGDKLRVTVIATGFPPQRRRGVRRLLTGLPANWPGEMPPSAPALNPEDWSKPAFMRLKVRRLK